ncbi:MULTISPECIES: hypothetical protein [Methylomicrobium]|nr:MULTISPECIES: hypothetical protein [Methylomicrobium]
MQQVAQACGNAAPDLADQSGPNALETGHSPKRPVSSKKIKDWP